MRTPRTRELAERALTRLMRHVGTHADGLVVVGGLNPALLAPRDDAPHQGTVDVDVALDLPPVYDRDDESYGWLERALHEAGFRLTDDARAWRWTVTEDGTDIHLDILCDVTDSPGQELALPGTRSVTAQNLEGPVAALGDAYPRPLSVAAGDGDPPLVVRYAGLGGYLLAKASAVVNRGLPKDLYDLAFVLLNCPEGPAAAGLAARRALPSDRAVVLEASFRAAVQRYADHDGRACHVYADQRARDGESTSSEVLRRDASAAARLAVRAFDSGVDEA